MFKVSYLNRLHIREGKYKATTFKYFICVAMDNVERWTLKHRALFSNKFLHLFLEKGNKKIFHSNAR